MRVRLEHQVSEVIGLSAARRMEETGGGCFDLAIIPRLLKKHAIFQLFMMCFLRDLGDEVEECHGLTTSASREKALCH